MQFAQVPLTSGYLYRTRGIFRRRSVHYGDRRSVRKSAAHTIPRRHSVDESWLLSRLRCPARHRGVNRREGLPALRSHDRNAPHGSHRRCRALRGGRPVPSPRGHEAALGGPASLTAAQTVSGAPACIHGTWPCVEHRSPLQERQGDTTCNPTRHVRTIRCRRLATRRRIRSPRWAILSHPWAIRPTSLRRPNRPGPSTRSRPDRHTQASGASGGSCRALGTLRAYPYPCPVPTHAAMEPSRRAQVRCPVHRSQHP